MQVAARWPGWTVTWDRDRYETQLEATAGLLSFPERTDEALLAELTGILLVEVGRSPAETVLWFAEHERESGKSVEVNPLALRDDRLELSPDEKAAVLKRAVRRLGLVGSGS